MLILFWGGVKSKSALIGGLTREEISSYYLILIVVVTVVMSHIEEEIAKNHIREGGLVRYLVRPFPYLALQFLNEMPHRLLQGVYGVIGFFILQHLIPNIPLPIISLSTVFILVNAYFLCFIVQATLSLTAFWITDMAGILNTWEVIRVVLSGLLVPITFLPNWVASIAYATPFPYIIYFPVISLQGNAPIQLQIWIIFMQFLWMALFFAIYKTLWHFGLKRFSGVGQ